MRNKAGEGCSGSWCTGGARLEPEQAEEEGKEKGPLALSSPEGRWSLLPSVLIADWRTGCDLPGGCTK